MERSSGESSAKQSRNDKGEVENEHSGISFSDLPSNIVENIVLRLSVNRIVVCKCVCKTWYEIISDPGFAKQHFARSQSFPLVRSSGPTFLSRMLYLVQEEKVDYIEHALGRCSIELPGHRCLLCRVNAKLNTNLRIPLRNFESIQSHENVVKLKMKDHNYRIVNSCNGLLCLSKPYDSDPVIICNPITGEFINLPEVRTAKYPEPYTLALRHVTSGFGFCPATGQYKVIRTYLNYDTHSKKRELVAEVHVLGTKSWKVIDRSHYSTCNSFPTSLNGCLYWLSEHFVTCFDIDKECFGAVSLPPLKTTTPYKNVGMGLLGDELCVTEVNINDVNVWAMKDNDSAELGWSKLFSFPEFSSFQMWPHGSLQPIRYLGDRGLLMFNSRTNGFIYKDPEKVGYKYLRVRGIDSQTEAIAHCPSFVSLNDILAGHDVEVLNVNSRCGALKLHNESKVVSLIEDDH